jgi:hypothetical protein
MSSDRSGVAARFMALLDAEIDRRRFAELAACGDPREALARTLDEMRARLLLDPDYRPDPPHLQRRSVRQLEGWLRRHGYGTEAPPDAG